MTLTYNQIKRWYDKKLWSKARVKTAVKMSIITAEQYETITGEPYAD